MNNSVFLMKPNKKISVEIQIPDAFPLLISPSQNRLNPAKRRSQEARKSLIELQGSETGCLLMNNSDDFSYTECSVLEENYFAQLVGLERRMAIQHKLISSNKQLEQEIINLSEELKGFIVPIQNLAYEKIDMTQDTSIFSELFKTSQRIKLAVQEMSGYVVYSQIFEWFVLLIIVINVILLAVDSPNYPDSKVSEELDVFFIAVYTIECALKIMANGLVLGENAYLRDWWNFIDFTIVVTSWVGFSGNSSMNLKSLRTLRVLRPLRGVSSVQGVRVLILSLYLSLKPLINAIVVLFVIISIFAILGLQLWIGALRNRCLDIETGIISDVCGFKTCRHGSRCADTINNPIFGTISFDSFFYSWLNVFQIITLEGWTKIFGFTSDFFSEFVIIYYILLILFGNLLILNLTVAVLTTSFTAAYCEVTSKQNLALTVGEIIKKKIKNSIRKTIVPYDILLEGKSETFAFYSAADGLDNKEIENVRTGDQDTGKQVLSVPSFAPTLAWRDSERYKHEIIKSFQYARIFTVKANSKNIEKLYINDLFLLSSSSEEDLRITREGVGLNDEGFYQDLPSLKQVMNLNKTFKENFQGFTIFVLFEFLRRKSSKKLTFFKLTFSVKLFLQSYPEQALNIGEWSGQDVNPLDTDRSSEIKSLQNSIKFVPISKLLSPFNTLQKFSSQLTQAKFFNIFSSFLVSLNIVALSSDYHGISSEGESVLFVINSICTWFFIFEFITKLLGQGMSKTIRDYMNIVEFFIIILSLLDFFFSQSRGFNAFRALRVLRLFRVIRVFRIFRYLDSMAQLISIISNSMSKFMYLLLLLLLIHLIFTLLAMELYGNHFNFPEGTPRSNFDSFHWAFVTIFQVLSNENWDSVLRDAMRSDAGHWSSIFLVVWIIIGNFIILNLFLGILLGGFELDANPDLVDDVTKNSKMVIYRGLMNRKSKELKVKEMIFRKYIDNSFDSDAQEYSLDEMKQLTIRDTETNSKDNIAYTSFCLFKANYRFRQVFLQIVLNTKFEIFIFVITILNLIALIWETYIVNSAKGSQEIETAKIIDITFTLLFTIEFCFKSIALGFCSEPGTYIRDHWNKLDLIILVLSLIDISMNSVELSVFKVLRSLRILRPLKLIRYNISMKIVIKALFNSIISSLNVIAVVWLFWLIFSILGVSLFKGKFYTCDNPDIKNIDDCVKSGYSWVNYIYNYDNILEASLTLFIISSQETWPERMFNVVDAANIGESPITNYNPSSAYFVIFYVFIGDFFLINLFTIVVYTKFAQAKQEESSVTSVLLSRTQLDWVEVQKLVIKSKPAKMFAGKSEHVVKRALHTIISNEYFKVFILIIIIINTIHMAMMFEGASPGYNTALAIINDICTYVFIVEAIMKLVALGPSVYFNGNWNKFDFFVVVTSISFMVTQEYMDKSLNILRFGPQLLRSLRVLRLTRIVKLFQSLKYLQDLMHVIVFSMPAALNVLCLMMIIFMMYAILGVYLFWQVSGTYVNEDWNFRNFHKAMLILWRISTGEDYPYIMKECIEYYNTKSVCIYFTSFVAIVNFILLEFFVSVIIQNYKEYVENPMSAVHIFNTFVKRFKNVWIKYSKDHSGIKIKYDSLDLVFRDIGKEIGISEIVDKKQLKRLIHIMKIYVDSSGFIYYHDLLYAFIRRKYARMMNGKCENFVRKILERHEFVIYGKLKELRQTMKKKQKEHLDYHEHDHGKVLMGFYYMRMFFSEWKKYHRMKKSKLARSRNIVVTAIDN